MYEDFARIVAVVHEVTMKTDDGSTLVANFKLK